MNTSKQVNVMIGLLFVAFLTFGAYIMSENSRASAAAEAQDALVAERGATLFVANCRTCHGLEGHGANEGGIAPQLNTAAYLVLRADNPFGLPATAAGDAQGIHDFLFNTISCGRTNTPMPTWSARYGGPLSEQQISYIVSMIMQGRWDLVEKIGAEHDHDAKEQEAAALTMFHTSYSIPAGKPGALTKEQKAAVDAAIVDGTATTFEELSAEDQATVNKNYFASIAPDPAALAITTKNCGQYSGATAKDFRDRNPFVTTPAAPTPAATPTAEANAPADNGAPASGTVDVSLKEWSVTAATPSVDAGKIQFDVKNDGAVPHEFVVVKSDAAADQLPVSNGTVDVSKVQVVEQSDVFNGGESKQVTADLAPGTYVLFCNVVGHYQLGMHTTFTVK